MVRSAFARLLLLALFATIGGVSAAAQPAACPSCEAVAADDVAAARAALEEARALARSGEGMPLAEQAQRMVRLGLWQEAETLLDASAPHGPEARVAKARLLFKQHRYEEARALVDRVLREQPRHQEALLLRGELQIQAWVLEEAAATARVLLAERPQHEGAALLLGRIRLLQKRYDEALKRAEEVQRWNRSNADAHLLEANVYFWKREQAAAEQALVQALEHDPFNADARFRYGYAIWRRVDAAQLGAMAAQWNLALELDPLHYLTHWHFGNGHTHLTYADYAAPADSLARRRLGRADSLLAQGQTAAALSATREVGRRFPESALPAMMRGSVYYMAYDMNRAARLDSAQATFERILARKPNYGSAHNGLAAVIKQRQFAVLAAYDSLEAAIARTPPPQDSVFYQVFPGVRDYPGRRVERMVRQQLGPSIAYLPLLHRLGRTFAIPPLHVDLAEAMGRPSFRYATTFDNRQWMDIRGVGSGAAGIEYVERGAHLERNVLAHEYTHLFHGRVMTDAEERRIRALYYVAMEEDRTLDYYAANNESEYFAQGYAAYLSPAKVHPLTHKAMNTKADLQRTDPALYAFVDSLVASQNAYRAGDTTALASNWAEVYVRLSEQVREEDREAEAGEKAEHDASPAARLRTARAHLDSALVWDAEYVPAMLSYAALLREHEQWAEAEQWLARAEAQSPNYAPVYQARAEHLRAQADALSPDEALLDSEEETLERQAALYRKALALEKDYAVQSELSQALRQLYLRHARIPEAIEAAEAYAERAPAVSTYLRDRREEAQAFAHTWHAALGYAAETLDFFEVLVEQNPQNFDLRLRYADALAMAGQPQNAMATLEEAQRILQAAGSPRPDYMVRLAALHLSQGDTAKARAAIRPVREGTHAVEGESALRLLRVKARLGVPVGQQLDSLEAVSDPFGQAEQAYTRGYVQEERGQAEQAARAYREALASNPYHCAARVRLVGLLNRSGRDQEASALVEAAAQLKRPLGPEFLQSVERAAGEDL